MDPMPSLLFDKHEVKDQRWAQRGWLIEGGSGGVTTSPHSYYRARLGWQKLCLTPGTNQYSFNKTLANLVVKSQVLPNWRSGWTFLTPQPLAPGGLALSEHRSR